MSYRVLLVLHFFVTKPTKFLYWLHCKDGFDGCPLIPMWVVDIPFKLLPHSLRKAVIGAWHRRWLESQEGRLS